MTNLCSNCGRPIIERRGLTPRLADCLEVIERLSKRHNYAPSYREIAREMDTTASNAHRMVTTLLDRGYVQRMPGAKRSIILV